MPDEKQDVFVHCAACDHEWVACQIPMDAADFAKAIGRQKTCPKCHEGGRVYMGRATKQG